ncbi:NAD(P)-binding domain-containing protein [Rapidithrix thailandica]|uniref:NAD(P)-binding domain-containing protein n=1 Tax=Rapidithrix thailandica TaxID=413964 RepID=A0AAW9S179_9BACT
MKKQKVTVIGLGAMGTALAKAFLNAGHTTTVWNRSPEKARPLVAEGANLANSLEEAVEASPLIVICVLNYKVLRKIIEPVGEALEGRTLVSLTNDTPEKAREMAVWTQENNIQYLDGSVLVPVPVIGSAESLILYSGPKGVYDTYLSTLKALGGRPTYLGEEHGIAALYDMGMMNIFFTSLSGVLHSYALVGSDGVAAKQFLPFAKEVFAVAGSFLEEFAENVDGKHYPGDLDNITMEAAGIEHILEASRHRGMDVGVLNGLKTVYDRAIAAGYGANGMPSAIEGMKTNGKAQ